MIQTLPHESPRIVFPQPQAEAAGVAGQAGRQVHQVLDHTPQTTASDRLAQRHLLARRQTPVFRQRHLVAQPQDVPVKRQRDHPGRHPIPLHSRHLRSRIPHWHFAPSAAIVCPSIGLRSRPKTSERAPWQTISRSSMPPFPSW
jgi:hypothetical protein